MYGKYSDVVVFVTAYVLLSLLPFLFLNRDAVQEISTDGPSLDVVSIAILGATGLFVLVALLFAKEGVTRYNDFLVAPTDFLSILVILSFVLGATSWWAVPELALWLELGVEFDLLLVVVLFCQLPMILFLGLLTAIGKA